MLSQASFDDVEELTAAAESNSQEKLDEFPDGNASGCGVCFLGPEVLSQPNFDGK